MAEKSTNSRRKFIKQLGAGVALSAAGPLLSIDIKAVDKKQILKPKPRISPNDKIRFATIGMGIMGYNDTATALKVPNAELVAAADLYDGRLSHVKELYGKDIFTTRDYREILNRKDIDAVIVTTHDLWHDTISIDAMNAGKAVYCEKPMVQHINLGHAVIATQKKTGKVLQVGSQRISSIAFEKAKHIYESGKIGKLNLVEAKMSRHDALGAWQYSIPPDASPETMDFDTFLKNTKKVPFDPVRFFRWRNYNAYGTGIPGDLFVHLLTGLHFITSSFGPERILASGELSYWKDGRDVPDVMTAIMDYPETKTHPKFQVMLSVNFADGGGEDEYTRLIGTEGMIEMSGNSFKVKMSKLPQAPGYGGWDSIDTFSNAMQKAYIAEYDKKYPPSTRAVNNEPDIVYSAPKGYDEHVDHFHNFFNAMQGGKPVAEDATFGLRAAAPAIACNLSYFQKKIIHWDPVNMKLL